MKTFKLKRKILGIPVGTRFTQSARDPNIYFYTIPIRCDTPEADRAGAIKGQAVKGNSEWFEEIENHD